jgi:hypothetical protein
LHHCLLPAQRCAVVAAAPPAVPLQRRYRPRSARAVCAAPGSVPATARCRSIAASLCACSASPAGARRCASAACASATVQRCAQPLRSHRPRTNFRGARACSAAQHRRITALRCRALHCTASGACGSASLRPLHAHLMAVCIGRARCKVLSTTGATPLPTAGAATLESTSGAHARLPVRTSPRSRPPRRKLQVRRHHRSRRRRSRQ